MWDKSMTIDLKMAEALKVEAEDGDGMQTSLIYTIFQYMIKENRIQ